MVAKRKRKSAGCISRFFLSLSEKPPLHADIFAAVMAGGRRRPRTSTIFQVSAPGVSDDGYGTDLVLRRLAWGQPETQSANSIFGLPRKSVTSWMASSRRIRTTPIAGGWANCAPRDRSNCTRAQCRSSRKRSKRQRSCSEASHSQQESRASVFLNDIADQHFLFSTVSSTAFRSRSE